MYNIFLCYRRGAGSQGSLLAARLYDELGSIEDFKPFYAPQVVEPGDNFRQVSLNAIAGVKVFILLLTPGFFDECSNDDDPVRAEIQTALDDQHIRFISICLPGFDAAQEFTKSVRACFQGAFADRIEHIAYAQCSDPKSFNVADVLEKPIRKLFCLYDDEKREQGASTMRTKGEDIADDRLTIENGVLVKCDKKAKGRLIIPDCVTRIGDYAFDDCDSLTSVAIPDSVTSIGEAAFRGCDSLEKLTVASGNPKYHSAGNCVIETAVKTLVVGCKSSVIPDDGSVTSIGERAFCQCDSLTSITIPDSVTSIGDIAFSMCHSLTSITIPDSVTSIGHSAFHDCRSLVSVILPRSVAGIRHGAFYNCHSLISITIPNGVTSIEDSAFHYCTSLTSVTIPNSVTRIGDYAFKDCTSLTSITIANGVMSIGYETFAGCTSLTAVRIPDSVKSIGRGAFYNCASLTSVNIGNGVTSIGHYAFHDCDSLTSVIIGNGVTSIGVGAFYNCCALTSVAFKGTVAEWNRIAMEEDEDEGCWDDWFEGCEVEEIKCVNGRTTRINGEDITDDRLTIENGVLVKCDKKAEGRLIIPYGVTSIGGSAFEGCTSLTSVTIGDSVTSIGNYAFSGCRTLASVAIPSGVTSIGKGAFIGCDSLATLTVDDSNIVYHSADNCMIETTAGTLIQGCKNSIIPADGSVTSIGDWAFGGCYSLTSVTIPDSVTNIKDGAFSGCTSLTSVTIGNSVTSIGVCAFSGCTSLTSVTIPDSVTSIGYHAFSGCTSLTSVTIPDSVTSIGRDAFGECTSLESVYITDIGKWVAIGFDSSFGNCDANPLYYAGNLYLNGELVTDLVIPDGVTSIGYYAFRNCKSLTSVTIPDGVESIGIEAFSGCTSLTSVTIGNSVTSIGDYAFYNCNSLTSVTIGKGVKFIDWDAFRDCKSLSSVTFEGTKAEWKAVRIGWSRAKRPLKKVECVDGKVRI